MRVGGPARFFAEPNGIESASGAIAWAKQAGTPVVVLGAGTNIVFADEGFPGLVLRTSALRGIRIDGIRVAAAAGEPLSRLAWSACERGLSGLEWACGIPGSVGGAVVMNAGTRDGDVSGMLASADVLTDEGVRTLSADSLRLGYRTSAFLAGDLRGTVVEATFVLQEDDPSACVDRARTALAERVRKLPVGASAGCIFRNPDTGPTAGQLLDRAGCKGLGVGRAAVSSRHANVIVNEGVANASDVLALIERMKRRVLDAFGVELREEIVIYS